MGAQQADGAPVGVFTAFWRRHRALAPLPAPAPAPTRLTAAPWPREAPARVSIDALRLRPTKPDWSGELGLGERTGESGARASLETFVAGALGKYAEERDALDAGAASRLSANLRFGEISPRRVAHAVETAAAAEPSLGAGRKNISPSLSGAISPPLSSTPILILRRRR